MSATLSLFAAKPLDAGTNLVAVGKSLQPTLQRMKALERKAVSDIMTFSFMGTDAAGAWDWRMAYEAQECAQILNARRLACQLQRLEDAPAEIVELLHSLTSLGLTHTRRNEEQEAWDQFSSPLELGAIVALSAQIRPDDLVLEPSAGTGMLAIMAEILGAKLHLNELGQTRYSILKGLFPQASKSNFDALELKDRIPLSGSFDVVVSNPPFQGLQEHLVAALDCLADGGRLSAIVPSTYFESKAIMKLAQLGDIKLTMVFPNRAFTKHGTSVETGLFVIDRVAGRGEIPALIAAETLQQAVAAVLSVAPRQTAKPREFRSVAFSGPGSAIGVVRPAVSTRLQLMSNMSPVAYTAKSWSGETQDIGVFSAYHVSRIDFEKTHPHPSSLVESSAMATTPAPAPTYIPNLTQKVQQGGLSDAQLETVIYAGQAHEKILPGKWVIDDGNNKFYPVKDDNAAGFNIRQGFFLGDGTGVGKGRQISAIVADNIASGRTKAVWISKNETLLEDARRDWIATGGSIADILPQSQWKLGTPIRMDKGILFTTYGTLRTAGRRGKESRLEQIVKWLGPDFDGALIFDEAHEMANAAGGEGSRGKVKPSQQGLAGLLLQFRLPNARVVYVSATGATEASNLAYACRLGLWGSVETPFMTREEFLDACHSGGVATLELIARELKAKGLYIARSLSFDGVEIDPVTHDLTEDDITIWDKWADCFQLIYRNLQEALDATNVTTEGKSNSGQHNSAAKSAFAGAQQRFFNSLLCGLKAPTIIRQIKQDLEADMACVVQLVTTNQATLERRLEDISPSEYNDLTIDLTPRDVVTTYLENAFPTTLMSVKTDDEGKEYVVPVLDEHGRAVHCQDALRLRDELMLELALLPAVPGLLDAIIHHFGPEAVAEVTGRSRRVVPQNGKLVVQRRSSNASQVETDDFQSGKKRILVFSQAGGTGRSYHADRNCKNTLKRSHMLGEPGWQAAAAIQGLGRTHRSNQACAPIFRPITTSIKGEKRFISTISRRLDSMGAITKGERRSTGGGMFRPQDNLENEWARRALVAFFRDMYANKIAAMTFDEFEYKTALRMTGPEGDFLAPEDLPPLNQFLNRLLSLRISEQNALFDEFELRLTSILATAETAGLLDKGVEDVVPADLKLLSETVIRVDETGAETKLLKFEIRERRYIMTAEEAEDHVSRRPRKGYDYVWNAKSKRPAIVIHGQTTTTKDDNLVPAVTLIRPFERETIWLNTYNESNWATISKDEWQSLWQQEVEAADPFVTSTLNLVTGLLLPIWKFLPKSQSYVKRVKAADGQRWLGRVLNEQAVRTLYNNLGINVLDDIRTDHKKIYDIVAAGEGIFKLASGFTLKRSRVMDKNRLELVGNPKEYLKFKALGAFVEIIAGTARCFLPVNDVGMIKSIIAHYPVEELAQI